MIANLFPHSNLFASQDIISRCRGKIPVDHITFEVFFLLISIAQIEIIPGRPDLNAEKMLRCIAEARQTGVNLLLFPEMSIPGYLLGDTWEQPAFLRDCEYWGKEIIQATDGLCVMFGNVGIDWHKKNDDGRVRKYNAFFAAQNGVLLENENFPYPFRIKTLQPNYREFDDDRHFYSLRKLAQELHLPAEDLLQPLNVCFNNRMLRIGCLLCEDGWSDDYALKPIPILSKNGPVDLFINLSCSPFTLGKNNKRHRVFSRMAREAAAPVQQALLKPVGPLIRPYLLDPEGDFGNGHRGQRQFRIEPHEPGDHSLVGRPLQRFGHDIGIEENQRSRPRCG